MIVSLIRDQGCWWSEFCYCSLNWITDSTTRLSSNTLHHHDKPSRKWLDLITPVYHIHIQKPKRTYWQFDYEEVSPFPLYFSRFFSVAFGSHSRFTSQSMNSTSLLYNEGLQFCLVAHVQIGRRSSAISLLTLWDSLESPVVWRFPLWELLGILLFSFVHSRGIWTAASTLMGGCVKAPRIRSKNLIR